jgi:hypothetical protein
MRAKLYRVTVYEGTLAQNHNMGQQIWEVFIEETGATINELGGVFKQKHPRPDETNEVYQVEIPYDDVTVIGSYLERKDKVDEIRKKIFTPDFFKILSS